MVENVLLDGKIAATLAQSVYGLRTGNNIQAALAGKSGSSDLFELFDVAGTGARVTGKSGAIIRPATGFGLLMQRKGAAAQGEYVLAIRGTEFSSVSDWLSNGNVTLDRGPGGMPVHAGFNRVYRSMSQQVNSALKGKTVSRLHVIGHSLGGALANMFAAEFKFEAKADVSLYTFGCPRPGTSYFSNALSSRLGEKNIRRIYSLADPVPMVPLWPFSHPQNGAYAVNANFSHITIAAHSMEDAYLKQMPKFGLPAKMTTPNYRNVDYWINQANTSSGPFTVAGYWALGKALSGLIALADRVVGTTLLVGATLLDGLSSILVHAAKLASEIGDALLRLINAVLKFLGRTVMAIKTVAEITGLFLRTVLNMLFSSVAMAARGALEVVGKI